MYTTSECSHGLFVVIIDSAKVSRVGPSIARLHSREGENCSFIHGGLASISVASQFYAIQALVYACTVKL